GRRLAPRDGEPRRPPLGLPPRRPAVPRVRHRDRARGDAGAQAVLVPELPARGVTAPQDRRRDAAMERGETADVLANVRIAGGGTAREERGRDAAMARGETVDVLGKVRIAGEGRELLAHPDAERDGVFDVWIADGGIADIAPAGAIVHRGAVLDAGGAWVVPGLWDHHAHFLQWSLAGARPSVEAADSPEEAAGLAGRAAPGPDGRRVLSRLRPALWPDAPTRDVLDAATSETPTYLLTS